MDLVDGVHWGYLHEKGCHYTELCSTTSRMEGEGKRIYRGGLIDNVAYVVSVDLYVGPELEMERRVREYKCE